MDTETRKALEACIAKYEGYTKATYPEFTQARASWGSIDACALCRRFHPIYARTDDCGKCPVAQARGLNFCEGTPYEHFHASVAALEKARYDGAREERLAKLFNKVQQHAAAELKFLRSLLPKES